MISDDFAAVIDGSTSKTDFRLRPPSTNGRVAMEVISDYISTMPREITCEEFLEGITRHIHYIYSSRKADLERARLHPECRLTASAAIYSAYHRQVWLVGDCQAIVDGQRHGNEKPHEHDIAARRAEYIKEGVSPQEARRRIVPLLLETMRGQNVSYAVIDGFPVFREGVKMIPVKGGEVILATDGFPFLCPTLRESETMLSHQLVTDPQNVRCFLATKGLEPGNVSFDDRAYVRIRVDD